MITFIPKRPLPLVPVLANPHKAVVARYDKAFEAYTKVYYQLLGDKDNNVYDLYMKSQMHAYAVLTATLAHEVEWRG